MSNDEKKQRTWVLLDPSCYVNLDEAEVDKFGASVIWGSHEKLLLKTAFEWCTELIKITEPLFKSFTGKVTI